VREPLAAQPDPSGEGNSLAAQPDPTGGRYSKAIPTPQNPISRFPSVQPWHPDSRIVPIAAVGRWPDPCILKIS